MNQYNPKEIEKIVRENWAKKGVIEKLTKFDMKKKKFYLLDGPPYINGIPHVGHAMTTAFKDIWGRFKLMQGYSVWLQPGFDCGGLPIENKVEKELGIQTKSDIEKIGADRFIEECNKYAKGNEPVWLNFYKNIGALRGWLNPYLTSENYYIESGWWTVKTLYEKGLLVEGTKPSFWCSHCETVLSGYEVTDSYKDVEDPSIFVKFPLGNNEYLLVWTTTPWTLNANVAVCVHPEEIYVKAKVGEEIFILAEKRLQILDKCEIIEKFSGKKLEGLKYKPLLDIPLQEELKKNKNAHRVVLSVPILKKKVAAKQKLKGSEAESEFGHIVDMETGSGIVHIAPGHGDVDNRIGKHYNLPEPSPVDEKCLLTKETGKFTGIYVKKADEAIMEELESRGLLYKSERIVHSYPLCWRCKTPLIFRMSKQWFLKIDTLREKMLKENKKVNWLPDFGKERFHSILEEAPDWAVTRQRYWGIPLPVWVCEKCNSIKVIGSLKELMKESVNKKYISDLHKNSVDKIEIKCRCKGAMKRVPDIMDVWFDSGIAPWASLGYPYKNKALFEKLWPVDLIDESQDQVRGWFYSLMFSGFATFGKRPYNNVCLNGWVLDEKGEKMAKSLGNVVLADEATNELGADLLRLYYCYENAPWDTHKFSLKNAKELGRSINILWNTYQYFKTYCKTEKKEQKMRIEDRWLLSKLNSLIEETEKNMETFNFHLSGRAIIGFIVDDFSRTYIKLVRERSDSAVNYTITEVFEKAMRLLAPICPFITDYIYSDLFAEFAQEKKWPSADKKIINKKLEESMIIAQEIIETSHSIRKEKGIKLRWPLHKIIIETKDSAVKKQTMDLAGIIKEMANVKIIEFGRTIKNMQKKEFSKGIVYLDTEISDELKEEALLRELLREIQSERKKRGLIVTDRIVLTIDNTAMKKHEKDIKEKVGASEIIYQQNEGKEVRAEELSTKFRIEKA